ncbi:MAG: glycosyl transferase family 28 [Muribaculaceae bacterium]|nr:glycosyl transferase family 28 [Muribaculaceae bacterium]MDE6321053.1 glycosyl transferase family 28 [Muribaculaceae bacterium]
MIFAAVGTQFPFDRLIKIIDAVVADLNEPVLAQTLKGEYKPANITTVEVLPPAEFRKHFDEARVIVTHAGMGVILTAMEANKPVIVCPRNPEKGEILNEHQLATTARMREMGYVYVAEDEETMRKLLSDPDLKPLHHVGPTASESLVNDLTSFIDSL